MKNFLLASALLFTVTATSTVSASETAPVMDKQSCDKVVYPKAALINEETGTVELAVLVGADGAVMDSKVEKSSGSKTLDKATAKVFSSCKFKPGSKDGKPQQAWTKLEYVWSLS
jgi:protein TonB